MEQEDQDVEEDDDEEERDTNSKKRMKQKQAMKDTTKDKKFVQLHVHFYHDIAIDADENKDNEKLETKVNEEKIEYLGMEQDNDNQQGIATSKLKEPTSPSKLTTSLPPLTHKATH